MESDPSNSMEISLNVASPDELTLEDTLEILKDLKLERDQHLEKMYENQINNKVFVPISKSTNILEKQQQLTLSMMNEISKDSTDEYSIPNTIDQLTNTMAELANEIKNTQEYLNFTTETVKRKGEEIKVLKGNVANLEDMKKACITANKYIASKTYEREIRVTNNVFKEVKTEVQRVVAELFSNNFHVRNFLADLCSAYFSEGEDVYVEILPEVADAANFLFEASLIRYHPYDNNKVRLMDL